MSSHELPFNYSISSELGVLLLKSIFLHGLMYRVRGNFWEKLWAGFLRVWVEGINFWFMQKLLFSWTYTASVTSLGLHRDNDEIWLLAVESWKPVMSWPVSMSISVCAIWNQNHSEYERIASETKKESHIFCNFSQAFKQAFWPWITKRRNGEFQVSLKGVEISCSMKWCIFYFDVHSNVSTWTTDRTTLNMQFHSHVSIQIHCGIEKSVKSVCVLSIERYCFHFYPETPLILRWPKSYLFLAEASFIVEVLQFWGKMVAQGIWGSELVPHVPCCPLALGVSGILSFSRSSSFPALGFSSFEMKSAQTSSMY